MENSPKWQSEQKSPHTGSSWQGGQWQNQAPYGNPYRGPGSHTESPSSSSSNSSIASDRLQKAIERNRRKQMKKENEPPQNNQSYFSRSNFGSNQNAGGWKPPSSDYSSQFHDQRQQSTFGQQNVRETVRESVAKPNDFTFVDPYNKTESKAVKEGTLVPVAKAAKSLTTRYRSSEKRSASISIRPKKITLKDKFIFWTKMLIAIVVILRLFFSEGGVMDYLDRSERLQKLQTHLRELDSENRNLKKEIARIESDPILQKQLVRDGLGFIGPDEYMILFRSSGESSSN